LRLGAYGISGIGATGMPGRVGAAGIPDKIGAYGISYAFYT